MRLRQSFDQSAQTLAVQLKTVTVSYRLPNWVDCVNGKQAGNRFKLFPQFVYLIDDGFGLHASIYASSESMRFAVAEGWMTQSE